MRDTTFLFEKEKGHREITECVNLKNICKIRLSDRHNHARIAKFELYDSRDECILVLPFFKQTFDTVGSLEETVLKNIDKCVRLLKRLKEVGFYSVERQSFFLNQLYGYVEERYDKETTSIESGNKGVEENTDSLEKSPSEIEGEIESLVKDIPELESD